MIISLDTETTGIDLAHGAKPFLVTTCDDEWVVRFWEWDVNPLTRQPDIPPEDLADVAALIDAADLIYLHNAKFDARALAAIGIALPWEKVRDTLVASHLLASNHGHRLDQLCVEYLHTDIEHHELHVKEVVTACRAVAKRDYPTWRIAREGMPDLPSVKSSSKRDEDLPWKNDMWLPRALVRQFSLEGAERWLEHDPKWLDACAAYANADSEHTLALGVELERKIRQRDYWPHYMHRIQLMRADCEMEEVGITARGDYTAATIAEYEEHVACAEAALVAIAEEYGHELELAKGAAINDNMRDFFYGAHHQVCPRCDHVKRVKHWLGEEPVAVCPKCAARKRDPRRVPMEEVRRANLGLAPITIPHGGGKKRVEASLDKEAMQQYLASTDGAAAEFIETLLDKRNHDTAIGYMEAYRRYWIAAAGYPGYYRIHAFFNPCGTDHLRQSSSNPNMQNVSGESKEISNRACFGPLPGREWWSMDYKQIEARIPAYESGEPSLVQLFDRPDEGPHWGSTYNLVASIFYPDKYAPHAGKEGSFKRAEPVLYKRAKFFWLARQYGAGARKGDSLAGFEGASRMVEQELTDLTRLQDKYLRDARRLGYVETLPTRAIDPTRGYPILASRTEDGGVMPTTPFNYHVSGTACECKNVALVRCADQCAAWREEGFDAWLILEVHDQLLFDFPRGDTWRDNWERVLVLKGLMEQSGEDLIPRIPTPVTVSYHTESWAEEVELK